LGEAVDMILSKKSRYGLRALLDLTVNSKNEHMALNAIADRNGISAQYLEQVFAALRRAGIVKSIKGPQGGYSLNKRPEDITVAQIVLALDGSYSVEKEVTPAGSCISGITETIQRKLLDRVNKQLDDVFTSITLKDLADDYIQNQMEAADMYYI